MRTLRVKQVWWKWQWLWTRVFTCYILWLRGKSSRSRRRRNILFNDKNTQRPFNCDSTCEVKLELFQERWSRSFGNNIGNIKAAGNWKTFVWHSSRRYRAVLFWFWSSWSSYLQQAQWSFSPDLSLAKKKALQVWFNYCLADMTGCCALNLFSSASF